MLGKGPGQAVALAFVIAVIALVVWHWPTYLFLQSDTFWLIETGRYIVEHHSLPVADIYSFTRAGSPWFVYQWFFEVILAWLFQLGGWLAVSLFAVIVLAWMFFVSMVRGIVRNGGNAIVAFLMVCFGCAALMPDLVSVRPQLLTFLFLWLVQVNLDQFMVESNSPWKRILWLPLIMLLWVNVHISFVIELLVLAVYFICAVVRRRSWRPLLIVTLLCLAASLVNPHGPEVYSFLYRSWQEHIITPELSPIVWTSQPLLLLFALLTLATFALSIRTCAPQRTLLAGFFLVAGLAGARFIEYFVIWSTSVAAELLTVLGRNIVSQSRIKRASESLVALISSRVYRPVVLLTAVFVTLSQPTLFPSSIPVKAAEYLSAHRPAGRLFCGEHAGSYLIFLSRGTIPVFIDTRVDVYGKDFCRRFGEALVEGRGWQDLVDQYQIRLALVMNKYRLADMLEHSSQWRVVYTDNAYTIFQRGNSAFEPDGK